MTAKMVSWWASHHGRHLVQQLELSMLVALCELEFCWASRLVWAVGHGWGHVVFSLCLKYYFFENGYFVYAPAHFVARYFLCIHKKTSIFCMPAHIL